RTGEAPPAPRRAGQARRGSGRSGAWPWPRLLRLIGGKAPGAYIRRLPNGPFPLSVTLDLSRAPAPPATARPPNPSGLTRARLAPTLVDLAVARQEKARMRASQLWRWMHHYGVTDFAAMTDIAKETRALLAERCVIARPEVVERQVSKDGTRKWLIRTAPG